MAEFLLASGANPDGDLGSSGEGGDWGWTPLMRATRKGFLAICELLIRYGADRRIKSKQERGLQSVIAYE